MPTIGIQRRPAIARTSGLTKRATNLIERRANGGRSIAFFAAPGMLFMTPEKRQMREGYSLMLMISAGDYPRWERLRWSGGTSKRLSIPANCSRSAGLRGAKKSSTAASKARAARFCFTLP